MNILQTVKYFDPSKGGTESVVKSIVDGVTLINTKINFTIYSNHHFINNNFTINIKNNLTIIKERTPFIYKSQPIKIYYPFLDKNINKFDIIHHHYPFPNMELNFLKNIKILKTKKFIITWHANINNSRWSAFQNLYNPITRKLLSLADSIVVTSEQLKNESLLLNNFENKVKIIPLSFDPIYENNNISAKIYNNFNIFKIIFVGKLRKYKGVNYLIEAIKYIDVHLKIVGDGEEKDNLLELIKLNKLESKVQFFDNLSNSELLKLYKDSDIFVLPSINEAEAFGVVQLEAMANGLPIINTRLKSGVPFVSIDSITGYTVEPKNVEQLTNAILTIKNNKDLYNIFSKNCIDRAKLFSIKNFSEKYNNLYNNI